MAPQPWSWGMCPVEKTLTSICVHGCEMTMCAGKVVIDAFRLTDPRTQALGQEPRQTTSNLGHLQKPSIQVRCGGTSVFGGDGRVVQDVLVGTQGIVLYMVRTM